MRSLNNKIWIVFTVLCLMLNYALAINPSGIEISTQRATIKVGEPLVLKLTYRFKVPQISHITDEVLIHFSLDIRDAFFRVRDCNGVRIELYPDVLEEDVPPGYLIFLPSLTLQGTQGLEYSGNFVIFYNLLKKEVMFSEPGTYKVDVRISEKQISNSLEITVEPASELEQKALSLLSDPNDCFFLEYGEHEYREKRPVRMAHLRQVVKQGGDTLLAKWAAARLGIEESKDLEEKYHRNSVKFMAQYQKGKIKEPLLEQAYAHLTKALSLPDEFPIRQEVLGHLISTEIVRGNYQTALSYANEIAEKYPKSEYAIKTSSLDEQIQRLKKQLSELPPEPNQPKIEIKPVDIEALLKWLEEIWLSPEVRETMTEEEWQEFIEFVKSEGQSQ